MLLEKSLIVYKPDGILQNVHTISTKLLKSFDLRLIDEKEFFIDEKFMLKWRNKWLDEMRITEPFRYYRLISSITFMPVIAQVWEGINCCEIANKIKGAFGNSTGLRGVFGFDDIINVMHVSDDSIDASNEIPLFFPDIEIENNELNNCHILYDFWTNDTAFLSKKYNCYSILKEIVTESEFNIIHEYFHQFIPNGVTGFFLLSESHVSIHTWPEKKYACIDLFFCNETDTDKVIKLLRVKLKPYKESKRELLR